MLKKFITALSLILFCTSTTFAQGLGGPHSTYDYESKTTIVTPPPSAISPTVTNRGDDQCTMGVSGGIQTQILGLSSGQSVRDLNCERLKLSKTLFDMGMKVAAVSTLCQDERVFEAMWYAGTPCPIDGKIGDEAKELWISSGVTVDYTLRSPQVVNSDITPEPKNSSGNAVPIIIFLLGLMTLMN